METKIEDSFPIFANREGIFVSLKKGVTSTLVYENPKTKEIFEGYYSFFKSSNAGSKTEGS